MTKPVLFIPGYPGSHLVQQLQDGEEKQIFFDRFLASPLLAGPDDLAADERVRAGEPIKSLKVLFFEIKQADSLYDVLNGIAGLHVEPFGWDWRRPVWDAGQGFTTQERLRAKIEELHDDTGEKVTVIGHSTGGLVARHLFEAQPGEVLPHVERLITFGVPWAGLLRTMEYLVGKASLPGVPVRRSQEILARSWAAYDLIPPDPAHLRDPVSGDPLHLIYRNQNGGPVHVDPLEDTGWVQELPGDLRGVALQRAAASSARLRDRKPVIDTNGQPLDVVNVVGWGARTLVAAEVTGGGLRFERGQGDAGMEGGDGTAPRRSAAWIRSEGAVRVRTYHLPIGFLPWPYSRTRHHLAIWRNPGARNLLSHLLGGEPLQPFVYAAVDENDYTSSGPQDVRLRIATLDADGQPLFGVEMTVELKSGDATVPLNDGVEGRHLVKLPRSQMRDVGPWRRFVIRFRHNGAELPAKQTFRIFR